MNQHVALATLFRPIAKTGRLLADAGTIQKTDAPADFSARAALGQLSGQQKSVVFRNGVFGTGENHEVGDKKTLRLPDRQCIQPPNLFL